MSEKATSTMEEKLLAPSKGLWLCHLASEDDSGKTVIEKSECHKLAKALIECCYRAIRSCMYFSKLLLTTKEGNGESMVFFDSYSSYKHK